MIIVRCGVLGLTTVIVAITAWAQDAATVQDILTKRRAGGHVLVLRHGATHTDQADTDPLNLDNVAKQRQLNDKGRADARALGEALKRARRADRKGIFEPVSAGDRDGAARSGQGARDD